MVASFPGSGSYSSGQDQTLYMTLSSANARPTGNWSSSYAGAPAVTLDSTYTEQDSSATWSGSFEATALEWQGPGTQSNLDLNVSTFSCQIALGSS